MDPLAFLLSAIVFSVYAVICVISVIFTFFLDLYHKIDQALQINVISARTITPLEQNIYVIDAWLMRHNQSVGLLLIILSLVDLRLSFEIINKF